MYGSAKHAGMKKAAVIFLKSRKFINAWFDKECVGTPVGLPKNILQCTWSRLTVQCWWKTKKININILIAKVGAWAPSAPPLAAPLSWAKGKIAPAVLIMRQNRHCQIYWQILHPEKNSMRSTVLQVRGRKSPLLLGGETLGLRCSAGADRVMYNKFGRRADSGQKLLMRCGQQVQIFCLRHLYWRPPASKMSNSRLSKKQ